MKKRTFLLALVLTVLVFVGYAVAAGGDASDPLVSLDFLNGTFRRQAEERIDEAVTKADAGALDDAKARWNAAVAAAEAAVGSDYAAVFTEARVKQDDILSGVTGLQVIPLAGELTVSFSAGTVVDVTDGRELTSGSAIPINHRCLVAEDTTALFTCTSKTAVLSYCGSYHFALSDKPDRNAMAEALQSLSLFRGTGSGIGSGYELEKTPTRAEALIMLIRMLGEEKAALACTASQPFIDVPDWCAPYVAYAYERGYSNGVGTDSLGHSYFGTQQTASAAMYMEFMLRAPVLRLPARGRRLPLLLRALRPHKRRRRAEPEAHRRGRVHRCRLPCRAGDGHNRPPCLTPFCTRRILWIETATAAALSSWEVAFMCNNGFGGGGCCWIIIIILLLICCCGCGGGCGNGCGCNSGCGCNNGCGC